jgi:long-chain acyl-CoA synthetase
VGENIYPEEIEDVLTDDAAVIGAPDDKWGEVVVAHLQVRCAVQSIPSSGWCSPQKLSTSK